MEKIISKNLSVAYQKVTEADKEEFRRTLGSDQMLVGREKVVVTAPGGEQGYTFMETERIGRLGKAYIKSHVNLQYSRVTEQWEVWMSENDYYNDLERNPEKEIPVRYVTIESGSGREVYKGIEDGRYYLRESHYPKENFAKWFVCGTHYDRIDAGDSPRPNLIFTCNGMKEKVRYDDWNGVAAYSDTFNQGFRVSSRITDPPQENANE